MSKYYVDPTPGGWRHGFPKVWDKEKWPDMTEFLHANGWPKDEEIVAVRMWTKEDDTAIAEESDE